MANRLLQTKPQVFIPAEEIDNGSVTLTGRLREGPTYTSNPDGSDSGTGVTGLNAYGAGVNVDPPVNGLLGLYIPGMGSLQEVTGNASAADYSLTAAMATVQPVGCSPIALVLTPGRYLVMVTVAASGLTAADILQIQVLNTGTNSVISSSQQSAQVSGTGEIEIEATFYVNVTARAQYVVQAMNATGARGVVKMARTKIDALQIATASTSLPQCGVSSFTPNFGLSGTAVTITGFGFANATGVYFGGMPAASYAVNSDTQITAVLGAGSTGAVGVSFAHGAANSNANYLYQSVAPSPGGISTGLYRWFSADVGVTLISGGVSSWADQSSNVANATQAASGNRPTLVTNALNSLPAIQFVGASIQYLSIATLSLTNYTVLAVYKYSAPGNYVYLMSSCFIAGYPNFGGGTGGMTNFDGTNMNSAPSANDPAATFKYRSMTNTGVWITGVSQTLVHSTYGSGAGTSFNATTIGNNNASSSFNFDGQLCELIIYNVQLSTSDRQTVEAYLHSKWGV